VWISVEHGAHAIWRDALAAGQVDTVEALDLLAQPLQALVRYLNERGEATFSIKSNNGRTL
jgi:hypothetical protein